MKDAFMCKLDGEDSAWIEQQALVFGSRSAVLRLVVRLTRILISLGIIVWSFDWLRAKLQIKLQDEEGNQRNPAAQVAGKAGALGDGSPARAPRHISATSHRNRLMADAAATGAIASAFSILPARLAMRSLHP